MAKGKRYETSNPGRGKLAGEGGEEKDGLEGRTSCTDYDVLLSELAFTAFNALRGDTSNLAVDQVNLCRS